MKRVYVILACCLIVILLGFISGYMAMMYEIKVGNELGSVKKEVNKPYKAIPLK